MHYPRKMSSVIECEDIPGVVEMFIPLPKSVLSRNPHLLRGGGSPQSEAAKE
jgi:hypothetical protein